LDFVFCVNDIGSIPNNDIAKFISVGLQYYNKRIKVCNSILEHKISSLLNSE